jgi:hypothetical protein
MDTWSYHLPFFILLVAIVADGATTRAELKRVNQKIDRLFDKLAPSPKPDTLIFEALPQSPSCP